MQHYPENRIYLPGAEIMAPITIRFSPGMCDAVWYGRKVCTSRREKKGNPGDWFYMNGAVYRLVDVFSAMLWTVKNTLFKLEGCASPEDFEFLWRSLHDGEFDESVSVWVHFFAPAPLSEVTVE